MFSPRKGSVHLSALTFSYILFAVQTCSNKNTDGQAWLVRLKIADVFP